MTPLRRTNQRQIVLRAVKFSVEPVTAEIVARIVKKTILGIGKATLYRNLLRLVEAGEIYQVESRDGVRRYIGHTYHTAIFTCQRCGKVRQLKSRTLPAYVDRKMFGDQVVTVSELTASGLCATCAKKLSVS